ncbi:MAG: transporter substrate-binding domain-containing protein, partial [Desulforhopalus sp.]|nr:transporter substrate-binding domain-containing protein [Desulforhopalus sp.]
MKVLNLLIVIVISLFAISSVSAENFRIMTEEYPPFNYTDGGKITGLSTEVVLELAKRVGHHTDIEVLPWARAYGLIQKKDGMI